MNTYTFTHDIPASPATVWEVVADHGALARCTPLRRVEMEAGGRPDPHGVGAVRAELPAEPGLVVVRVHGAGQPEGHPGKLGLGGADQRVDLVPAGHVGQRVDLEHGAVELDEEAVLRALAKYGPSMAHAMAMYRRLVEKGIDCEVEFAVDETDYPTKPVEHVVVVRELQRLGMEFVSFAPRFVGRFEKGVEFIGDLDELQRDFEVHAQLARALGPYKLSLHSGSDKYSTYPLIAEATQGMVHLKTAGTSWAEALRVVAAHEPDLMRAVLTLALESFEANVKSYHLSCDPAKIPTHPTDEQVARLLDVVDSRQVLHVGYGAILAEHGPRLFGVWSDHEEELYDVVADHFVKHLQPFAAHAR